MLNVFEGPVWNLFPSDLRIVYIYLHMRTWLNTWNECKMCNGIIWIIIIIYFFISSIHRQCYVLQFVFEISKLYSFFWWSLPVFFQVDSFEDLLSGEQIDIHKPFFCAMHPMESVKYFCNSCQVQEQKLHYSVESNIYLKNAYLQVEFIFSTYYTTDLPIVGFKEKSSGLMKIPNKLTKKTVEVDRW